MRKEDILEKVVNLISTISEVEDVTEESEIIEDLGISSMDVLYLVSCMEAEFSIKVPEKSIRKMETVGDIIDIVEALIK